MTSYQDMTDEALAHLSLKDETGFYCLIRRYESRLLRYIKQLTHMGQEEAEDILQEVLIKVYKNLNGFNPNLSFSSWIYRIARNEAVSQYRKNKAFAGNISLDIENEDAGKLALLVQETLDTENVFISHETAIKIQNILEALPEKYREILLLRYFEDQGYKEIGDILKKPQGTVATLINRAKMNFKKLAKKYEITG